MSRSAARPVGPERRRRSDGEVTRRRVLDAAVDSILENGYYHTSSNEIGRRAGVTWGAIQHQFGSRENLLLEILNEGWRSLQRAVATTEIAGVTLEERLGAVMEVLAEHYGRPPHLAQLQILLDLTQNPATSAGVRRAALEHGRALAKAWQPLFARALGAASQEQDLLIYAFSTLRAYLTGNLIASSITPGRSAAAERLLVVRGVASVVREEAQARGIQLD